MKLGTIAAIGALLLILTLMLFPIYWMVMTALLPTDQILSRHPVLWPRWSDISFAAFSKVFELRPLALWIFNSLFVALMTTILSLVAATLAGYSLSRWKLWPQQALGASLIVSKLIPSSLIIIPIFIVFNVTGLIDSYSGLVLANMAVGVPLATWLMKSFFDRIPRELDQAAMIDGCTQLQALRYVVLPLAKPGAAACGVYLLIVSWSEFIFARTLMTSESHTLLTVGLQSFVGEYVVDWQSLMAAGVISLVPVVILFIILEPFLVSGMTKGALAN